MRKQQLLEWLLSGAEKSGYLHVVKGKQIPVSLETKILVCEETWKTLRLQTGKTAGHCKQSVMGCHSRSLEDSNTNSVGAGGPTQQVSKGSKIRSWRPFL